MYFHAQLRKFTHSNPHLPLVSAQRASCAQHLIQGTDGIDVMTLMVICPDKDFGVKIRKFGEDHEDFGL